MKTLTSKKGFAIIELAVGLGVGLMVIIATCIVNPVFFFGWANLFITVLLLSISQT